MQLFLLLATTAGLVRQLLFLPSSSNSCSCLVVCLMHDILSSIYKFIDLYVVLCISYNSHDTFTKSTNLL